MSCILNNANLKVKLNNPKQNVIYLIRLYHWRGDVEQIVAIHALLLSPSAASKQK